MEQYVNAAGHRINTLLLGKVTREQPTLVFIHGGLDCIGMWRDFPEQLHRATGYSCLVYDRWGHGKSEALVPPRDGDPREDEAGQPLADLFEHFGIEKAVLVGHSFGGAISLIAPGLHPSRIVAVVSIVPQLLFHDESRAGLKAAVTAYDEGKLRDKLIPFHGDKTDTLFRNWAAMADKPTTPTQPYEHYLEAVRCPVLAIFGKQDNYGYLPNMSFVQAHIHSTLEIFELDEAAHYPHLETPAQVTTKITEFLGARLEGA